MEPGAFLTKTCNAALAIEPVRDCGLDAGVAYGGVCAETT